MANQNAIDLLKADHDKVKSLFQQWQNAEPDQRAAIAEEVFSELELHAELEEQLFYPALRQKADEKDTELLDEALKEHAEAKETIAELKGRDGADKDFESTFEELIDAVSHHVQEEESEMLPRAEKKLAQQLASLGMEMQQRKEQAIAMKK